MWLNTKLLINPWSPPVWGRGLKSIKSTIPFMAVVVAPCVGAWVEILMIPAVCAAADVAPCVGAWVEIELIKKFENMPLGRPLCGGVG